MSASTHVDAPPPLVLPTLGVRCVTLKELQDGCPDGVKANAKEDALNDAEFAGVAWQPFAHHIAALTSHS